MAQVVISDTGSYLHEQSHLFLSNKSVIPVIQNNNSHEHTNNSRSTEDGQGSCVKNVLLKKNIKGLVDDKTHLVKPLRKQECKIPK